tara:strand:+ start:42 stop:644 length:603 start_codon:yes stop_codon:yes gene_type:complete
MQAKKWTLLCETCNVAHETCFEHENDEGAVYRSLSAQEHACGVRGESAKQQQEEPDIVDDFDGSKQLNILKFLGAKLDEENLGHVTSYAILDANTPPMLASDNIGEMLEDVNTAPNPTQYRAYGQTEEVERFQLTLMMENYYRKHTKLDSERLTLTVLYTQFKQEFASSLQMADQHDITVTFPSTDRVVNAALDDFCKKL